MNIGKPNYDVVVVGSGGGGLRSAVGAARNGAKTLVLCRGKANRSGATLLAGANISADISCDGATLSRMGISDGNRNDTPDVWFEDIVREGFYLNNQPMVDLYVRTAGDRLAEMLGWGLTVRRMEGAREVSVFGSDILDTLYRQAREAGVDFREDTLLTDLIVEGGVVCGVVCADLITGGLEAIPAGAVVLATGGAHNLFEENTGSTDLCGEGQAAAMRAGAETVDLEMISFCPTVVVKPTMYRGNILPYILSSTGYGRILNKYGKTFTDRYLAKDVEQLALNTEWNKMLLSYALNAEIQAGRGTRENGLYYALDLQPEEILEELYADLPPLKTGIYADIMEIFRANRSLVIKPAAHYFEGGIRVGTDMRSSVEGLFAAGECTGGMFGANRVAAATTEMLVEGAVAGESAARYARAATPPPPSPATLARLEQAALAPFGNRGGEPPSALLARLHRTTAEALPVIRTAEKLTEGLRALDALERALETATLRSDTGAYNREWREYLELRGMVPLAKAMLKAALLRGESRGVHVRGDALTTDNRTQLVNLCFTGTSPEAERIPNRLERIRPETGVWRYTEYIEKIVAEAKGEETLP